MAMDRVFVQDFAIAWSRDPLVAIDVPSGSPLRRARRRCSRRQMLHRFGAAARDPVAQSTSTIASAR